MSPVWSSDQVHARMLCPCGDWEFRRRDAAEGLTATERFCPKCERRILIAWRDQEVVGGAPMEGDDAMSYYAALQQIDGLGEQEIRRLVSIAQATHEAGLLRLAGE